MIEERRPFNPTLSRRFVLDTLMHEELSRQGQRDTVLRAARRHHAHVATTLFHAFQNFAGGDQRTADLLDWVSAGLSENPAWLLKTADASSNRFQILQKLHSF